MLQYPRIMCHIACGQQGHIDKQQGVAHGKQAVGLQQAQAFDLPSGKTAYLLAATQAQCNLSTPHGTESCHLVLPIFAHMLAVTPVTVSV